MKTHDKDCELLGGFHGCKCWLRARGRHEAMKSLDAWYLQQHPEDRNGVEPLMDKMNEALHTVDRDQERMAARSRKPRKADSLTVNYPPMPWEEGSPENENA